MSEPQVNYVKNLDFNTFKPARAGAIAYAYNKRKLRLLCGVDTTSKDITDLSGGVSYKTENGLSGGLREFTEESLGIFGKITGVDVMNCLAIYDENNLIIFIPLDTDLFKKRKEFKERVRRVKKPEVIDLAIIDKKQFISLIDGDSINGVVMYDKVRNLLAKAKENYNFLRAL